MADSRSLRSNLTPKIERLSDQLAALQEYFSDLPDRPSRQVMSTETARLRRKLLRARNAFRRLGFGAVALSGFIFVAFLAALFASQLSVLSGSITIGAALFLALVGYIFHLQADTIDPGEVNDD